MDSPSSSPRCPSARTSPLLMYNFMQVPPAALLVSQNAMHEVCDHYFCSCAQFKEFQRQQLRMFWQHQLQQMNDDSTYKQHPLPLARIKKIIKLDPNVKMVSGDTPVVFAKACELFILVLTIRSWLHAEDHRRQTIKKGDIADAVSHCEELDFLMELVPPNNNKVFRDNQADPPQVAMPRDFPAHN